MTPASLPATGQRQLRLGIAFALVAIAQLPTMADTAPAAKPFPSVEYATFHQLVFANEDVAVLHNLYPPKSDSGFHRHPRELFYVVIGAARAQTQKPGQPLTPPKRASIGSVGFNVMTSEPFVHRVLNVDNRPYHIVAIEIRRAVPSGNTLSERGEGYTQIFDNPRLRAWRIVLKPGQSTPMLTQRANGVRVVVHGGLLRTERPGVTDQTLALRDGDFAFQSAGEARALHNGGQTTIELVEMELK